MKVINKQKEYLAIENTNDAQFYINIGKYLNEVDYQIKKTPLSNEIILIKGNYECSLKRGDYILIDENGGFTPVSKKSLKENFIEIKEEN